MIKILVASGGCLVASHFVDFVGEVLLDFGRHLLQQDFLPDVVDGDIGGQLFEVGI